MARAVFFPCDWIVVTQLILRSAETSMFTSSSFWESMPIAARLHPPHPPPSVFAQTLRKVEATDCRRSRRIEPCVDLRHSLFPFRSRILQGHILGESLSCVTRNFQLICVQQNPFYSLLTGSPFEGYRCQATFLNVFLCFCWWGMATHGE